MGDLSIFQGVRPRHDVDRIDEKLGRDPRFFFVLAEAEQA